METKNANGWNKRWTVSATDMAPAVFLPAAWCGMTLTAFAVEAASLYVAGIN